MQDREELWRTGKDEPVEVNQRALIDKVLARYSGEFTLFRELLQNSDDARSHAVEIHFQTAAYLDRRDRKEENLNVPASPDLKSTSVAQWTFRNNGKVFTEQDWMRLPKIAEGNPGPEKIGAFGVGFYSLFSVTERPFVSSGGHGMQFYWKDNKDKLYVRRGNLPSRQTPNLWTTFEMPLREAGPIPPALELMRFLASSITFMVNLSEVGVFVDEHCIGCIKKLPGAVQAVGVSGELKCSSPLGVMNVQEIQRHPITIEVEIARVVYATGTGESPSHIAAESRTRGGFFSSSMPLPQLGTPSPPQQPRELSLRTTVDLTVYTAEVKVELDKKLSAEILRSTKKQPPSQLTYGLIYTGKDEYDRSVADQNSQTGVCDSILQGLRADLNGAMHTRIFIGHATGQTTGIGGHMASYFIPTVERESIDLIDRNIAVWNEELLYVGGFLSRAVYELELSKIRDVWEGAAGFDGTPDFRPPAELQDALHQQFLHILKFFAFHRSTPSAKVAQLLEAAFYGCSTVPLRFLSSTGVRSAPEIKEYDPVVALFLKYLPMLPQYVVQECPHIVEALPYQHNISPITLSDILQDLDKHALTQEELAACLQWWMNRKNVSEYETAQLLNVITVCNANGSPLQLSSVGSFIGSESLKACIPLDGPLPASLMSHDISTRFTPADLMSFGWQEFTILDWLRHISQPEIMTADPRHDFTRSIQWAEHVLHVLSGVWSRRSDTLCRLATSIFRGRNCIPTSHGLCSPEESFLSSTNITLFRDLNLPIVRFTAGPETEGDMEGFLSFIGVRKHVPPQLLLDKMVETGNWSISDLIGYLVQVQNTLTPDEFSRLKSFEAFTKEGAREDMGGRLHYRALDLYPPLHIFRQLQLPVIDWGERWQNESDQAELLYHLGLRRHPPLEKIVMLSSTAPDATVRETAFNYLCDNLRSKYLHYNPDNFRHIAFIPAESEGGTCLAKLGDVFLSTRWKALGFAVIQDSYRKAPVAELGVRQHPPTSTLIQRLETVPPTNEKTAQQWFECLCECISSFSQRELTRLSELPIIPARSPTGWQQLAPIQCYLGEGMKDEFHTKLFVFVDFGSTANRFLRACGSKNEPSVKDIAESLVEDPERFYSLAGGHEGFLAELRVLASRNRRIPNITLNKMGSRPILLCTRYQKSTDEGEHQYERALREPREITIADDMDSYQLFKDMIFVAPQDELEDFYASLGCCRLSTLVEEKYTDLIEIRDTETAIKVRTLILQRLPLFLRENTHTKLHVPVSLLSAENFNVRICKRLLVYKTLTIGNHQITRNQDVWAATKCDEEGQVELWLLGSTKPDMYEIATSLCRLLFGTAKISDTLLLTTILSTPLEVLKRRGYNIDKVPKQQQLRDSELTEEVINSYCMPPAVTTISATNHVSEQRVIKTGPSTQAVVAGTESSPNLPIPDGSGVSSGEIPSSTLLRHTIDRASNDTRGPIRNFTRRFVLRRRALETTRNATPPEHLWTPRQVIPQSYIRANVGKAMKACNPEGGKLLHHYDKVEEIREFTSVGYCDVSRRVGKLKRRGKMRHVKVFTTEDVPDADMFMTTMHDILARFVDVLTPLVELYGLPLKLLHVFYDVAGGPIAFNREGSIFLNLRYYEAWHDQDVQKGDSQQARISWFFALAHELAHNLIKEHNSEHEFWFAAICEAYISVFSRRLLQHTPV